MLHDYLDLFGFVPVVDARTHAFAGRGQPESVDIDFDMTAVDGVVYLFGHIVVVVVFVGGIYTEPVADVVWFVVAEYHYGATQTVGAAVIQSERYGHLRTQGRSFGVSE